MTQGYGLRFRVIALEPLGGLLVGLKGLLHITDLHLVDFSQVLLLRCSSSEVPFGDVVLDSSREYARSVLGIGLAIDLKGFIQAVGCIVGFVKIVLLDSGSFLECLTGLLV